MEQIHVLLWAYDDNSGFGVVKAFGTELACVKALNILHRYGDPGKRYTYVLADFEEAKNGDG